MKKRAGRRSTAEKEATRDALIASGMALFAKHGLDAPSLDDICAHAGYTRGAFYVHFADRDDFMVAVMDQVGRKLLDELLGAGGAGDLAGAAQRFVEAASTGRYPLMPAGGIRPHQLLEACARSRRLRERYIELVELSEARIAELVAEGKRAGLVRADVDDARAARLVVALVVGVQTLADLGVAMPVADLTASVVGLLAGDAGAPGGGARR